MSEVLLAVEFDTPFGLIKGKVSIDTGPMTLFELVPTAYELTDILVERARVKEEKAGRQITCKAGCGACCSQMVPLSVPEAFHLANLIDSVANTEWQRLFLDRFDTIVSKIRLKEMIHGLLEPEYLDGPVFAIAKKYFSLNMPCPFLENSSCSIHPHRPVACREYNVTSPASWCVDPYTHGIEKVLMPLPFSAPLARLAAKLTGTKPRLIPLTLAPLWVSEHSDLREQKWPGLELFKAFMAELGSLKQEP